MAYLLANNTIISEKEANLTAFLLEAPQVLKHVIWFGYGGIPLLEENLALLAKEFVGLQRELPPLFKNKRELFRLTKRMLNKNRFYRSGLITFQFFLTDNKIDYLITCKAHNNFDFQINKKGLLIDLSELKQYSHSLKVQLRMSKELLWNQANTLLKDSPQSAAVILNEKDNICEGSAANVFLFKDNVLLTPSPETGCYIDVLRSFVIELAQKNHIKVMESDAIKAEHLLRMEEVFLISEEKGIQWVLGYKERRYVHELANKLHDELNLLLEKKVEK